MIYLFFQGVSRLLALLLILPVRFYQICIGPLLPKVCRFHPSCSAYAEEALSSHGAVRGGWLTARRLCRCGPWTAGGYDPVPSANPQWQAQR